MNILPPTLTIIWLISGRSSPDYSYGISDPHENVQKTGRAVLEIWNERVNIMRQVINGRLSDLCQGFQEGFGVCGMVGGGRTLM